MMADEPDCTIRVTDAEGRTHTIAALEGWRVMEIIRDHGLPIKAECGGACSCATCHIYVDPTWSDRLHPARDEEIDMLDQAFAVADNSRLSCQVIFHPGLDGLQLSLAPGDG